MYRGELWLFWITYKKFLMRRLNYAIFLYRERWSRQREGVTDKNILKARIVRNSNTRDSEMSVRGEITITVRPTTPERETEKGRLKHVKCTVEKSDSVGF